MATTTEELLALTRELRQAVEGRQGELEARLRRLERSSGGAVGGGYMPADHEDGHVGRGPGMVLQRGDSWAEWAVARGIGRQVRPQEFSLGRLVQAMITGDRSNLTELERQAQTEGSDAAGGVLVAEEIAPTVLDLVRAKSVVVQARPDVRNGVLRRLGRRVERLSHEVAKAECALAELVADLAPDLLEESGVGPVCAAQLLVSSGDPSRMTSEASFAALAGTSPVEASSGKQRRHRLNRGGDRQLNWALHVVALQRIRHHPETSAYYERLLATGKSMREARRCVKRALARHFYHRLREIPTSP
jgi:transposase